MKHLTPRQHEILDSALAIIAGHGIQRMTIKNLAHAVHVSEPALYRHFPSKFDILMAILVRYRDYLEGLLEESETATGEPVAIIERLYVGMFRSFEKNPALSAVIFSEDLFRYDRRLSREVALIIEFTHDRIHRALRDSARSGRVRSDVSAKHLAWMVMGTMRLLVARWRISGYSAGLVKEGREAASSLRKVMAPQKSP